MNARQLSPKASDKKRRRVTQACDFCHRRSIRCRPSDSRNACRNCKDFEQECTYHRQPRRRGVQPRAAPAIAGSSTINVVSSSSYPIHGDSQVYSASRSHPTTQNRTLPERESAQASSRKDHWTAPTVASQAIIVDLIDVYFEIVYPIFPFFHKPSFTRRISRAEYTHDRALFAVVMAMCALVSRRVTDGAVSNPRWDLSSLQAVDMKTFIAQAKFGLAGYEMTAEFNVLRAHAILAIASIQNSSIKDMHIHLGLYHTLVSMDMLHDESKWPKNISVIEEEERRRLFWSMYTLDIYTSVVWGGVIRCREKQSQVAYPMEIDDELLNDGTADERTAAQKSFSSLTLKCQAGKSAGALADCWLSGWNFVTDLYRMLEHALARFYGNRSRNNHPDSSSLPRNVFSNYDTSISDASVADAVLQLYLDLPSCYKETPEMTFDNTKRDRLAFQAANITATLQLVRMVLLATGRDTIAARCQVAQEVLNAFASVPVPYLLAISTPLLHHLGGIGSLVVSVLDEQCTESEYRLVQSIMLSMAELLENLEPIQQSSGASRGLREKANQITTLIESRGNPAITIPELENNSTDVNQPGGVPWQPNSQVEGYLDNRDQFEPDEDLSATIQLDLLNQLAWNFDFGQNWD